MSTNEWPQDQAASQSNLPVPTDAAEIARKMAMPAAQYNAAQTAAANSVAVPQKPRKSGGLAFILALLFGPLGMFYVSVGAGLVTLILNLVLLFLFFPALIITWLVFPFVAAGMVGSQNAANGHR